MLRRRLTYDPRIDISLRRAYRELLKQGLKVSAAARRLCADPKWIHNDIQHHPLTEPIPDVDELLTVKEIAILCGRSYVQTANAIAVKGLKPAVKYCRVRWFDPSVMAELFGGPREAFPATGSEYDDLRMLATNDLTRQIYDFEHGAKVADIARRHEKGISPAKADRELAAFRGSLKAGDFRRFKQLIQFRVAVFQARSHYEEAR